MKAHNQNQDDLIETSLNSREIYAAYASQEQYILEIIKAAVELKPAHRLLAHSVMQLFALSLGTQCDEPPGTRGAGQNEARALSDQAASG